MNPPKPTKLEMLLSKMDLHAQRDFLAHVNRPPGNGKGVLPKLAAIIVLHFKKHGNIRDHKAIWVEALSQRESPPKKVKGKRESVEPDILQYHAFTSELTALALESLAIRSFTNDKRAFALEKLKVLQGQGLESEWESEFKKSKAHFSNPRTGSDFLFEYELNRIAYRQAALGLNRINKNPVQDILISLMNFAILETYKYTLELLSFQDVLATDDMAPTPELIRHAFPANYGSQSDMIPWFEQLLSLFQGDPSKEEITEFVLCLFKQSDGLPDDELQTIANLIQNRIVTKCNAGKPEFTSLLFDSYKLFIEHDILLVNGKLPPAYYKNACLVALKVDEIAWAIRFTTQYADRLPTEFMESAKLLNETHILFYQKQFEEVIRIVQKQLPKEDPFYEYDFRMLELLAFMEANRDEEILGSFAIKHVNWLKRHKTIAPSHRQAQIVRFNMVERILKLAISKTPNKGTRIEKLKEEIKGLEHSGHRKSLIEYLERKCRT